MGRDAENPGSNCSRGPVYKFLKEPLIRKFGAEWYQMLCDCAEQWQKEYLGEDERKF